MLLASVGYIFNRSSCFVASASGSAERRWCCHTLFVAEIFGVVASSSRPNAVGVVTSSSRSKDVGVVTSCSWPDHVGVDTPCLRSNDVGVAASCSWPLMLTNPVRDVGVDTSCSWPNDVGVETPFSWPRLLYLQTQAQAVSFRIWRDVETAWLFTVLNTEE